MNFNIIIRLGAQDHYSSPPCTTRVHDQQSRAIMDGHRTIFHLAQSSYHFVVHSLSILLFKVTMEITH